MNIEYIKEHKTKALLSFAIPSIIAMLLQTEITSVLFLLLFTPILKVLHADGKLTGHFTEYYRILLFSCSRYVRKCSAGGFPERETVLI